MAGIALVEGAWLAINLAHSPSGFIKYVGFVTGGSGTLAGWLLAAVVTGLFVWHSARLPSVRATLLRPSFLKALGLAVAVTAGFLEEMIFRKWLMDYLAREEIDSVVQVLASGLAFGLAHGIWGLMGRSVRAAVGAATVTGALGTGLAIVYIASGRSVAPCIAAHFLINALVEPGLVLAATRGEMGRH